jgi:hypothetical protein
MGALNRWIAGLVVTAGLIVVAAPTASADGQLELACTFTGHMNVFAEPVRWLGGNGSNFGFDSQHMACSGGHNASSELTSDLTTNLNLDASGTFTSLACGTTTTNGPAMGVANLTDNRGTLLTVNFELPFVAGQGLLTGPFTGQGPYTGDGGRIFGYVTISPNNQFTQLIAGGEMNNPVLPPPLANTCADQFAVAGAVTIVGLPQSFREP